MLGREAGPIVRPVGKAILLATVVAAALPALPKVAPLPTLRSHGLTVAAQFAADRQPGNWARQAGTRPGRSLGSALTWARAVTVLPK